MIGRRFLKNRKTKYVIDLTGVNKVILDGDSNSVDSFIEVPGFFNGIGTDREWHVMVCAALTRHGYTNIEYSSAAGSKTASMSVSQMTTDSNYAQINSNSLFILYTGCNDAAQAGADANSIYADILSIKDYVKSLGCTRIIIATACSRDPTAYLGFDTLAPRLALNTLIRNGADVDYACADFAAIDGLQPFKKQYFADAQHAGFLGHELEALKIMDLFSQLNKPRPSVSDVSLTGTPQVGQTITLNYTPGNNADNYVAQWFRHTAQTDTSCTGQLVDPDNSTYLYAGAAYVIQSADLDCYLRAVICPKSTNSASNTLGIPIFTNFTNQVTT